MSYCFNSLKPCFFSFLPKGTLSNYLPNFQSADKSFFTLLAGIWGGGVLESKVCDPDTRGATHAGSVTSNVNTAGLRAPFHAQVSQQPLTASAHREAGTTSSSPSQALLPLTAPGQRHTPGLWGHRDPSPQASHAGCP